MDNSLTVQCPHCWEHVDLPEEAQEGQAELIVDCEVCCRPMHVRMHVRGGTIETLDVEAC